MKMFSVMGVTTTGKIGEMEVVKTVSGEYAKPADGSWGLYRIGKEVFESRDAAVVMARQLVVRRITSLKKSLAKVEKFEIV